MTKVLLSNINSVWGVIVNPQSSNTYRHILSFKDEDTKKQFISNELFNGENFEDKIKNQHEIGFVHLTASTAEFSVSPKDYQNETIDSLLNKDFAIVLEEGEYKYYTLQGVRKGQTIYYTAELDIFFTYDITTMFNDKQTRIKRAMSDRYKHDQNGKIVPVTLETDINPDYDNPIFSPENFDDKVNNAIVPVESPKPLKIDLTNKVKDENDTVITDNTLLDKISNYLNTSQFTIVNIGKQFSRIGSHKLPYGIFVAPSSNAPVDSNFKVDYEFVTPNGRPEKWSSFQQSFLEDPNIVPNTYTVSWKNILTDYISQTDGSTKYVELTYNSNTDKIKMIIHTTDLNQSNERNLLFNKGWIVRADGILHLTSVNSFIEEENIISNNQLKLQHIFNNSTILLNPIAKRKNDLKLSFSPYSEIQLKTSGQYNFKFEPQYIKTKELKVKTKFGFQSEINSHTITFEDYKNIFTANYNSENNIFMEHTNYSLPTDINAWAQYINNNKSSQNAGWVNTGVKAGLGILGVLASPFTGGASLGITALAGVSLATQAGTEINSKLAQIEDKKREPDQIVKSASTFFIDDIEKGFFPKTTQYELSPIIKSEINDYFHMYGYNFNNRIFNINDYIKNRYRFNYIEANETFENIKLQASAEIKQLINDSLADGVTIWHVRDLNTFKGIKAYDYENFEISLKGIV